MVLAGQHEQLLDVAEEAECFEEGDAFGGVLVEFDGVVVSHDEHVG